MRTGLFIGRFQPFHLGHLEDVRRILQECDRALIAIGSAQIAGTKENPWSAAQRELLIRAALLESGVIAYDIVLLEDMPDNDTWLSQVQGLDFDSAYTGNDYVAGLLQGAGITVVRLELLPHISGTIIREMRSPDGKWRTLVPSAVASLLATKEFFLRLQHQKA
ncbi:nicotinamide-nucleotide adenylyltransferase [Candidatus Woesearchaeota archaeon CG_4_10_14_0_2_um_filter_57_5]|nr:MAG: hypothetical protein AUJ68_04730 [Candidatus Woesearchaeota archaeon CG1_02_57_44]PIZ50456.1 MAG: nicotinamide-nucleotide adenylyltransferase [Candidatus Woesearchaeota archaeon CG_4_10_14_0_2_um_filter_57_5]